MKQLVLTIQLTLPGASPGLPTSPIFSPFPPFPSPPRLVDGDTVPQPLPSFPPIFISPAPILNLGPACYLNTVLYFVFVSDHTLILSNKMSYGA